MRNRTLLPCTLFALATLAALAGGCAHEVYSPPSRGLPLESAATLAPKETSVRGSVQAAGAVFGPDIGGGSAGFRRGVSERAELQIDGTVMHVTGDSAADTHPNLYTGRVGVKVRPGEDDMDIFAFTVGAGGGVSAAGVFASADAGAVIAWENCYFVPYLSGMGFVSEPIDPRPVDTTAEGEKPGTEVDTPKTTFGGALTFGARVPLGHESCTRRAPVNLHAGSGILAVTDGEHQEHFFQGAIGLEIGF